MFTFTSIGGYIDLGINKMPRPYSLFVLEGKYPRFNQLHIHDIEYTVKKSKNCKCCR